MSICPEFKKEIEKNFTKTYKVTLELRSWLNQEDFEAELQNAIRYLQNKGGFIEGTEKTERINL